MSEDRRVGCHEVEFPQYRECEYGHEHMITSVLTGLTRDDAEASAAIRGGTVRRGSFIPRITDEEIERLRAEGVPVARSPYGLTFDGRAVAFSDHPSSLDVIRGIWKHHGGDQRVTKEIGGDSNI